VPEKGGKTKVVPYWVSEVNFWKVPFHHLYHEREVECVVSPVVHSVVDKDLFVGFDVSGGA